MGIEQTTYDFHDIVPKEREPTFAERNLPTFLGLARKLGYFQPTPEPEVEQRDYPAEMKVNMPEVPYDNGGQPHPLLYFFERVGELSDKVGFSPAQKRKFEFRMDRDSWERVISVPFHGDGTLGGDAMFHTMALFDYASEFFEEKGYRVTSAGAGSNTLNLELQRA